MDVSGGGGARLENARDDIVVVVVVVSRARLASARSGVVMAVDASESADGGMASESARARGNDALARREYDEAIRLYVESHDAGTTGGDRARAKANEAAVWMAKRDYGAAVTSCAIAWANDGTYARAKERLERLLVRLGSFEEGLKALGAFPEAKASLERLANARRDGNEKFKAGDFEGAIAAYDEGLREGSDSPPGAALLFANRAASRAKLGDHAGALEDADAALARDPGYQKAALRKGTALVELNRLEEADGVFTGLFDDLPGDASLAESVNAVRAKLRKPAVKAGVVEIHDHAMYQKITGTKPLVFVDFTATWCGPCKMIGPVFTGMATKFPRAYFLKVDVDENQDISGYERVSSMPTFAVYVDGKKVETFSGADSNRLSQMVSRYYANL